MSTDQMGEGATARSRWPNRTKGPAPSSRTYAGPRLVLDFDSGRFRPIEAKLDAARRARANAVTEAQRDAAEAAWRAALADLARERGGA